MEVFAIKLDLLKQKKKVRILLENRPILLVSTDHGIFAIRDKCPHMGATLSNGILRDGIITCKDHGLPISVETGEVTDSGKADFLKLDADSRNVRTYRTLIKDESVFVDL